MNDQFQQLMSDAPAWAREPAVLIGAGIVLALLLVWLLSRLTRRRDRDEEVVEPVYEEELPVVRPITPPPVTPPPPPLVEEPLAPPVIEAAPEPERYVAPEPEPEPEIVAEAEPVVIAPAPEPVAEPEAIAEPVPEPASPYIPDEAPQPAPIADEQIAAAAPFDASPASIAADVPEPAPEPPAAPEPVASGADELTRMKGVGPRLADRLNSLGITSFAQIAALTPEDADALDARLGDFQGRIHRDRWIEQAGYLANGDVAGFEQVFGKL